MLLLKPEDLKRIADHAEAAYPREACGLLLGFQRAGGDFEVTRMAESENKAVADGNDRFEIDPELRLSLMREARDAARERAKETFGGMDFVSREEFDAVKTMASKAREEAEDLKARVTALEARIGS